MSLSVIIPVLNEEAEIVDVLTALAPLRARGVETSVVDGGSSDRTVTLAAPLADRVLKAGGAAIGSNGRPFRQGELAFLTSPVRRLSAPGIDTPTGSASDAAASAARRFTRDAMAAMVAR